MAGQSNAAPVIIKRKKIVAGGGHHGGAWKVAYADFVTAMMAFFMLMWLLNATTEKQRKGIADYFNPTIPVNRISGGGDDAFGGDSVFTEETLAQNGTGGTAESASTAKEKVQPQPDSGELQGPGKDERLMEVEKALAAKGGESMTMERLLRHVVTRVTDEGLLIEVFDLDDAPLFDADSAQPSETLRNIAMLLAEVLAITTNKVAVNGHIRSYPVTLIDNPVWDLSANRAQAMRVLLEDAGMAPARLDRVTGHADRKPVTDNPAAKRNNRIEVILLRENR